MSIRFAAHSDLEAMLAVYAPYVLETAYSFEYTPPTLSEFTRRFEQNTAQFPWLVWEESGSVLGYAYCSAHHSRDAYRWCAEISIYLSPAIHGRGIGKRLYAALEEILRLQGYHTVYAVVTGANTDSLAFHEALGYRQFAHFPDCGFKFGKWYGIIWLEKRLKFGELPINFPKPVSSVVKNDENLVSILGNFTLF